MTGPVVQQHSEMRFAPGYVHAEDPEHPEFGTLTFTPGQLLPAWVREQLAAGAPLLPEDEGVFTLGDAPGRPPPRQAARPAEAKGSRR